VSGSEFTPFLGPVLRIIDEIRGRPRLRITLERDVEIGKRTPPPDRHLVWGGSRLKTYYLLGIQNTSTKPFRFMRAKLEAEGLQYPRWLSKKTDGVELAPKEPTHFLLAMEEVGELKGATLTVESLGWQKAYRL
jgi:hypothetical protein